MGDSKTCCKATPEEIAAIRKVLDLYTGAGIHGDSNVARPAFADAATMSFAENNKLVCVPIQALFDYFDSTGKQPASYEIVDCNVAEDIAMVRIESAFGDARFTDMFTLVKDNDGWKIVSKIYHVK